MSSFPPPNHGPQKVMILYIQFVCQSTAAGWGIRKHAKFQQLLLDENYLGPRWCSQVSWDVRSRCIPCPLPTGHSRLVAKRITAQQLPSCWWKTLRSADALPARKLFPPVYQASRPVSGIDRQVWRVLDTEEKSEHEPGSQSVDTSIPAYTSIHLSSIPRCSFLLIEFW